MIYSIESVTTFEKQCVLDDIAVYISSNYLFFLIFYLIIHSSKSHRNYINIFCILDFFKNSPFIWLYNTLKGYTLIKVWFGCNLLYVLSMFTYQTTRQLTLFWFRALYKTLLKYICKLCIFYTFKRFFCLSDLFPRQWYLIR